MTIRNSLQNMFRPKRVAKPPLERFTIEHDVIDEYVRDDLAEVSPLFRGGLERVPELEVTNEDGTTTRKRMESGADLNSDLFFSLYDSGDMPRVLGSDRLPPSKELQRQIMQAWLEHDDCKTTRAITRGNGTSSALGFLAVQDVFMDEEVIKAMEEHLKRQEEMREREEEIRDYEQQAGEIRNPNPVQPNGPGGDLPGGTDPNAQPNGPDGGPGEGSQPGSIPQPGAQGEQPGSGSQESAPAPQPGPITPEQWEALKDLAQKRKEAREALQQLADEQAVGLPEVAAKAVERAAGDAKDAAKCWASLPGNAPGQHESLPPDEAIAMGQKWLQHEWARAVVDLMGRLSPDFRFKYSTRTVGGREIPVDVETGNDLPAILPSEYMDLGTEATKGRFYKKFVQRALLQFEMVGSAETGKGPFVMLLDFSGSMGSHPHYRHIWAKAVALSMLSLAWREKRAVYVIAFDTRILGEWEFLPSATVDLGKALEFATLSPNGGTHPYSAMLRAKEIIEKAPAFRQADIVIATDGACNYDERDLALRAQLEEVGVRINGIAIQTSVTDYLAAMCTNVIPVQDLSGPSEATDMLVQAIV